MSPTLYEELPVLEGRFEQSVLKSWLPSAVARKMDLKEVVAMYVAIGHYTYDGEHLVPEEIYAIGRMLFGDEFKPNYPLFKKLKGIEDRKDRLLLDRKDRLLLALEKLNDGTKREYSAVIDRWYQELIRNDLVARLRAEYVRGL